MHTIRIAVVTAVLVALPAGAALAHPSLDPNAVPIGEPVEITVVVPHGCSTGEGVMPEGEGEAVPTTRFDLQVVEGMTVEPGDVDGWDTEVQEDAVVWTDAGGATIEPIELPVTLTVESGEPGDQLALSAFQECENGDSYRWTDGSEDTPPIALELTAGETGTAEMDHEDMDGSTESEPSHESESMEDMASEDATADAVAQPAAAGGSGSVVPGLLIGLAVIAAIGGGILVTRRRGGA